MSIKGLYVTNKKKPGKPIRWYVYAWRGGPLLLKTVGGGRPSMGAAEVKAYGNAVKAANLPDPDTMLSLCQQWRPNSPEWKALADGTKKTWGSQLNAIEAKWGKTPLTVWNDPRMVTKVVAWRDSRAETPRAADIGVMVLRELLKFGKLRGRVLLNVATEIPTIYQGGDRAEILWTPDEIDRFCVEAMAADLPQLIDAIWLAALSGLRREDLATVKDTNVYEFAIIKRALKRSKGKRFTARLPRIPELDALLVELASRYRREDVATLLVNSFGNPWSGDGLGGSFNRIRDAARIVHIDEETGKVRKKHLHDLRGTFCTYLVAGTDLTNNEVADIMAWSPERIEHIRRTYVDQSRVVVAIGERIAAGTVNRTVNRSGDGA